MPGDDLLDRHVPQAQERAPAAGAAAAALAALPAAQAAGGGAEAPAEEAAAQDEGGAGPPGQDAGALGQHRAHLEEDPHVLDGAAGGQQDGPPSAHLPVLQPHRAHLATGIGEEATSERSTFTTN